jgi:hypothetical protein
MEWRCQRKFDTGIAEAHDPAFGRVIPVKENVDTAIGDNVVSIRSQELFCRFQLPIAINKRLKPFVGKGFGIADQLR